MKRVRFFTQPIRVVAFTVALISSATVVADVTGQTDDREHAHQVTGVIKSIRIQQQGLEYGPAADRLDAEVLVKLANEPDKVYGVRYHTGSDPATDAMVDLLKNAYLHKKTVTIRPVQPRADKKNLNILWVEVQD